MRHREGLVAVCLAFSVGLAACVAGAASGGERVIGIGRDPESLDPVYVRSTEAGGVLMHVAETLFFVNDEKNVVTLLVEGWLLSKDGLQVTLYLRQGVLFQDGTPFGAAAVKVNLERFRQAQYAFLLYPQIESVDVRDEHTVVLNLSEPFAPLIRHLAHFSVAMLSPTQIAETPEGEEIRNPIGTGRFRLDTWVRGDYVRVVRNPDYWADAVSINSVVFKVVPSPSTRLMLLLTGAISAAVGIEPHDVPLVQSAPGVALIQVPSMRATYIAFNYQKHPFTDVRVRQAINYAVDKEAIVNVIFSGMGRVSDAPIPPPVFGHSRNEPYEYDPEKARDLLRAAGFPDGFRCTLYHPYGHYMMDSVVAEAVQGYLGQVGIEVELVALQVPALLAFLRRPVQEATFDMFMLGWDSLTLDADYSLFRLFHTSEWAPRGWNSGFYSNPKVDELLDLGRQVSDPEARRAIYAEVTSVIWQDAPWLFLYDDVQIAALSWGVCPSGCPSTQGCDCCYVNWFGMPICWGGRCEAGGCCVYLGPGPRVRLWRCECMR